MQPCTRHETARRKTHELVDDLHGVSAGFETCQYVLTLVIADLVVRALTKLFEVNGCVVERAWDGSCNGNGEFDSRIQRRCHRCGPPAARKPHHDNALVAEHFFRVIDRQNDRLHEIPPCRNALLLELLPPAVVAAATPVRCLASFIARHPPSRRLIVVALICSINTATCSTSDLAH
jgi:hypothetical protein